MLQIRPNCELCDKDLPADSEQARICSYECTFCCDCVDDVLKNVCPNCGGAFVSRPIRPAKDIRAGVSLMHHAASLKRVNTSYSKQQIADFVEHVLALRKNNG